jgi:hypothetical protein
MEGFYKSFFSLRVAMALTMRNGFGRGAWAGE